MPRSPRPRPVSRRGEGNKVADITRSFIIVLLNLIFCRASSSAVTLDPPGYTKAASQSLTSKVRLWCIRRGGGEDTRGDPLICFFLGSRQRSNKPTAAVRIVPSPAEVESLKQKKAWDVAMAPAKSVPMNAFMLYMSGSGVQIFSMMVVGMLLTNPLKAILSIKTGTFHKILVQQFSSTLWYAIWLNPFLFRLQPSHPTSHRDSLCHSCLNRLSLLLVSLHAWVWESTSVGAWGCSLQRAATGLLGGRRE
jgi:hypothetical protein